jgi:hypothetical protein
MITFSTEKVVFEKSAYKKYFGKLTPKEKKTRLRLKIVCGLIWCVGESEDLF